MDGGPAVANPNLRWDGQSWYRWTGSEWVQDPSLPPPSAQSPLGPEAPVSPLTVSEGPAHGGTGRGKGVFIAVGVVAAVAAAGTAFVLTQGGDQKATVDASIPPTTQAAPESTTPVAQVVLVSATDTSDGFLEESAGEGDSSVVPSGRVAKNVSGDAPGLYGGFVGESPCDIEELREGIAESGAAAQWQQAVGGPAKAYLSDKTPALLMFDTYVSRAIRSGDQVLQEAAVLQAGTPVLVDDTGLPVVSCTTGTPLEQPSVPFDGSSVAADPATWEGFRKSRVTTVVPANSTLTQLDLANLADPTYPDGVFIRPIGTRGEQDSQSQVLPTPSETVELLSPETPIATATQ